MISRGTPLLQLVDVFKASPFFIVSVLLEVCPHTLSRYVLCVAAEWEVGFMLVPAFCCAFAWLRRRPAAAGACA